MKKLTTFAAAALALAMTGAGALAETTLQLGTTVNEQDSFHVAAIKFAELVDERTNGEYKIEIYPNGTLGGESDMLDSMSTGMLDMGHHHQRPVRQLFGDDGRSGYAVPVRQQ